MCERPGFWWWLPKKIVKEFKRFLKILAGEPLLEEYTGAMATIVFLFVATTDLNLTLTKRAVLALLAAPSFLVMMHGFYRKEEE